MQKELYDVFVWLVQEEWDALGVKFGMKLVKSCPFSTEERALPCWEGYSFEFNETPPIADAINAMMITIMGDQSIEMLCSLLRQAYQQNIEILRMLDE